MPNLNMLSAEEIWKRSFICTVKPTVHNKRYFLVWTENILVIVVVQISPFVVWARFYMFLEKIYKKQAYLPPSPHFLPPLINSLVAELCLV